MDLAQAATGCLLGCAVGDALGLPREGLSPRRARRLFGPRLRHAMFAGRGFLSDDTEHAAMTAQALIASRGQTPAFLRALAWQLRGWILTGPPGVGLATARACGRLLVGVPPGRCGVWSAGNGPMMRAPVIGVFLADDLPALREGVAAATRITHADPRAERAALAVALAASHRLRQPGSDLAPATLDADLREHLPEMDDELAALLARALDPTPLTDQWPRGPSGYAYHTLLAVLHCWYHHAGDSAAALEAALALGGDADTVGAVLGGVTGATLGPASIPVEWVAGLADWPRSVRWLREVAARLAQAHDAEGVRAPRLFWPALPLRNVLCLLVILGHAGWRLLRTGGLR
jgi:ADP-ribosyl-[dinitrogen reductase] hydrolase